MVNGLVYSLDDDSDNTPVYWLGILFFAFGLHVVMLFFLTFKNVPPPVNDDTFTVSLDDSFILPIPAAPEKMVPQDSVEVQPKPIEAPAVKATPTLPPLPEAVDAPAVVVDALPPEKPKPAAPKPPEPKPAEKPEEVAKAEKRPLNDRELPSLAPRNDTAFDENANVVKNLPKNGYLSDRNSTAADRGPKNLPQGDPYIDKGDTNLIKYLNKRGEGNLQPLASDPSSGSVKTEGSPIAGDGGAIRPPDLSKSVKTAEIPAPDMSGTKLDAKPQKIVPAESSPDVASVPSVEIKPDAKNFEKSKAPDPEMMVSETGLRAVPKRIKETPAEPVQVPVKLDFDPQTPKRHVEPTPVTPISSADSPRKKSIPAPAAEIDKAIAAAAELDRFQAALNGVNSPAAGDSSIGKTGPRLRLGELGHEGNGTMRPGADGAVSDVTSINLDSSASEMGDPRFEKRFDAKTAYIKAFARRIDAKWKADIHAHLKIRTQGMVTIRIVLRKDGKLLEASEYDRNKGMQDECVALAKRAVEEAAKPSADPFPLSLADRETIEYTFNFLYQ